MLFFKEFFVKSIFCGILRSFKVEVVRWLYLRKGLCVFICLIVYNSVVYVVVMVEMVVCDMYMYILCVFNES